jgi:hypothetical protein
LQDSQKPRRKKNNKAQGNKVQRKSKCR